MGNAADLIFDESIQVISNDIDVNIFQEYRSYLAQDSTTEVKTGHLINSPEELEAFDHYLIENDDKTDLFVSFARFSFPKIEFVPFQKEYLQTKMFKCNDMEKVIRSLISDECFLDFNYGGALGKMPLHQMMLFENLFFNICYPGDNHEEYINELKKIIHRAKNRIYKNRSIIKQREMQEAASKSMVRNEDPLLDEEVALLSANFMSALSNETSDSEIFPIADPVRFEALDRLLKIDASKLEHFKQFMRLLWVKHEDADKVVLELVMAEVFLKFNYSGTAQRKPLKDMILFEQLLYGKFCLLLLADSRKVLDYPIFGIFVPTISN